MSEALELSLRDNAHDFMESAVNYANKEDITSWKYALLHLHAGLELLLKARLVKEHWTLLFSSVDKASLTDFRKGEFTSVSLDASLNRLQRIANVEVSEKEIKDLKSIRDTRNRIEHFAIKINLEQLKSLVAKGMNFFIQFYKNNFEYDEDYIFDLSKTLAEFDKFVSYRLQSLKEELSKSDRPPVFSDCRICFQDSLIIDHNDDLIKCLFCGHELAFEDFAEYHSEGYAEVCPQCGNRSLAFILYNNEEGAFECVVCGYRTEYLNAQ